MINLIKRFRKRPDIVEAFEWDGKKETIELPEIRLFMANNPYFRGEQGSLYIHTLDGEVAEARPGDFIVKEVRGEVYPCKPKLFWETYEEILPEEEIKEEKPKAEPKVEEAKVTFPEEPKDHLEADGPGEEETALESKPKPAPKPRKIGEVPEKFKNDIKALEERAGNLEELKGETLELDLQELNTICPRTFVKAKSYMGLVGYLKKAYGIELKITSQRSK
jgi:hypothetical protein